MRPPATFNAASRRLEAVAVVSAPIGCFRMKSPVPSLLTPDS
jgi:hypothetical protein